MSVSSLWYTILVVLAISPCSRVAQSSADDDEDQLEKPKELLRHQQNHRPFFIDRRLTLESRIQRFATPEQLKRNSVDSSTDSQYIKSQLDKNTAIIELQSNNLTNNEGDDIIVKYEKMHSAAPGNKAEINIEKPTSQIRHGRSRGQFGRSPKNDEISNSGQIPATSTLTRMSKKKHDQTIEDNQSALDLHYVESNETIYLNFDFEDGTVNINITDTTDNSGKSLKVGTNKRIVTKSDTIINNDDDNDELNKNYRRFNQQSKEKTSVNTLGRVNFRNNLESILQSDSINGSNRRVDSFEKLRKVVVSDKSRVKNRRQGISGSIANIKNSSRDHETSSSSDKEVESDGYGTLVRDTHDDSNFYEIQDRKELEDLTGYGENNESEEKHDFNDDDQYFHRRNSSLDRIGDYDENYHNTEDGSLDSVREKHDKQQSVQVDIVTRFLRIIENQHLLGENCTAGTDLNLGEGVVDQYAQERFRLEANLAVNRANMLTRLWKYAPEVMLSSEYLLHASILSMVEFDEDIFAAGNCYDKLQYRERWLYCPFAHRLQNQDGVLVKDLAIEYKYLSNSSEWFYIARKNAERVIASNNQFSHGFHTYTHNESTHTNRVEDEILTVKYEDGRWSKPYYDCGGGNIWMLTYTVPFFGCINDTYFFKGTSGIDIDLRRVDIDQCPLPQGSTQLNIFAASDKCKNRTTECVAIPGLGFRRGSYRCVCKRGYYYPDTKSTERYYNGTVIEEEYEKLMLNEESQYGKDGVFECLPCAEGCESCEDGSPCVVSLNWLMRTAILILECCIIACLPAVILFTWKFGNVKVVRAASPVLLRVIVLGAFFIYCTTIVMYSRPNVVTCTIRVWLREIGFSLTYGALMLKTWRISVIFRVKSAKAVKITDMNLLKRLGIIVTIFSVFLGIRTLVAPPVVIVARTADNLKAYLCRTDWWDHSFTTLEVMFLIWGIRLCIVVRKAPSEFNESRFISMAIYNEFLLSVFLNVSMLFLQSPANPDLLYIIFFCHTQLTVTLLLCLIFGSKAYVVFRGGGKEDAVGKLQGTTGKFIGKTCRTQGTSNQTNSISLQQGNFTEEAEGVTEEFRRLYAQLELLKEKNLRLGNRHLVTKIQAMQEAASHSETQVSTIQAISSNLRLTTEPSSSTIEETEVCSRNEDKSVDVYLHHRQDSSKSTTRNKDERKKSFECKNDTNDENRRMKKQQQEEEKRMCESPKEQTEDEDSEVAKDKDDKKLFTNGHNVNHEVVADNGEGVAGSAGQNLKSSLSADSSEAAGLVESSTRIKEVAAAGSSSSSSSSNGSGNSGCGTKERGKNKSGHARTHAIVINLDDKSRFSEEVTV